MIALYVILGLAVVIAAVIVLYVTKAERKNKLKWEEHRWEAEAEEKELEDLDILFEDIWDEVKK